MNELKQEIINKLVEQGRIIAPEENNLKVKFAFSVILISVLLFAAWFLFWWIVL